MGIAARFTSHTNAMAVADTAVRAARALRQATITVRQDHAGISAVRTRCRAPMKAPIPELVSYQHAAGRIADEVATTAGALVAATAVADPLATPVGRQFDQLMRSMR